MIFVTVGSDLPFDRLVRHVDIWAAANRRDDVFAQIGDATYVPTSIAYANLLEPAEFSSKMSEASAVVAHAGMGTILSALRMQKPIIVFPRRTSFREIRNEHQLATARYLKESTKVHVALDESELFEGLDRVDTLAISDQISDFASNELLSCVRAFIAN